MPITYFALKVCNFYAQLLSFRAQWHLALYEKHRFPVAKSPTILLSIQKLSGFDQVKKAHN